MNTPPIVSPEEWEAARQQLLVKEKEFTRARDRLAAQRACSREPSGIWPAETYSMSTADAGSRSGRRARWRRLGSSRYGRVRGRDVVHHCDAPSGEVDLGQASTAACARSLGGAT